ncbi:MAG: hypothetical protein DRH24_18060 [Deltaproteobacteria bacterium]|nr:MAG: hypothetical protein DRH24_18060 [Deltaproteobacteria bacterium]
MSLFKKKNDFNAEALQFLTQHPEFLKTASKLNKAPIDKVIAHVCEITPNGDPLKVAELKFKLKAEGEERTPFISYHGKKIYIQPSELLKRIDGVKEIWLLRDGKGNLVPYSTMFLTPELLSSKGFVEKLKRQIIAFKPMTINEKQIYKRTLKRIYSRSNWWQPLVGAGLVFLGMIIGAGIFLYALDKASGDFLQGAQTVASGLKQLVNATVAQQVLPAGGG